MVKPGLTVNYTSDEAIPARRLVKFGTTDGSVALATAATDLIIGVSELGCTAASDRVDIIRDDIAIIEFGGTVTRGQPLTATTAGKAIVATVSGSRIIGVAEVSGVSGDWGQVMIALGYFYVAP